MSNDKPWPQAGRERLIVPQPVGTLGTDLPDYRAEMMAKVDKDHVLMMGDNPPCHACPTSPPCRIFSTCA